MASRLHDRSRAHMLKEAARSRKRHTSRPAGRVRKNGRPPGRCAWKARQECLGTRRPIAKICFGSSSKGACLDVAGRIHPSGRKYALSRRRGALTVSFRSARLPSVCPLMQPGRSWKTGAFARGSTASHGESPHRRPGLLFIYSLRVSGPASPMELEPSVEHAELLRRC